MQYTYLQIIQTRNDRALHLHTRQDNIYTYNDAADVSPPWKYLDGSRPLRDPSFNDTSDIRHLVLIGDIFEGLLLRLWNEQRRQDASEHDKGKRLEAGFKAQCVSKWDRGTRKVMSTHTIWIALTLFSNC